MKVLLVDKCLLFLQALQNIMKSNGIQIVGTALNIEEALSKARSLEPDVVIQNISEADSNSMKTTMRLIDELPAMDIIIFTDNEKVRREAVKRGASAYLLTRITGNKLLNKLHELEMKVN